MRQSSRDYENRGTSIYLECKTSLQGQGFSITMDISSRGSENIDYQFTIDIIDINR